MAYKCNCCGFYIDRPGFCGDCLDEHGREQAPRADDGRPACRWFRETWDAYREQIEAEIEWRRTSLPLHGQPSKQALDDVRSLE